MSRPHERRQGTLRVLRRATYWLLVLVVSLILVILLLGFFESRDASEVGAAGHPPGGCASRAARSA